MIRIVARLVVFGGGAQLHSEGFVNALKLEALKATGQPGNTGHKPHESATIRLVEAFQDVKEPKELRRLCVVGILGSDAIAHVAKIELWNTQTTQLMQQAAGPEHGHLF